MHTESFFFKKEKNHFRISTYTQVKIKKCNKASQNINIGKQWWFTTVFCLIVVAFSQVCICQQRQVIHVFYKGYFCLKGRTTQREGETFHLLAHSPNGYNSWNTWEAFHRFPRHIGRRVHGTWSPASRAAGTYAETRTMPNLQTEVSITHYSSSPKLFALSRRIVFCISSANKAGNKACSLSLHKTSKSERSFPMIGVCFKPFSFCKKKCYCKTRPDSHIPVYMHFRKHYLNELVGDLMFTEHVNWISRQSERQVSDMLLLRPFYRSNKQDSKR